MLLIPGKVVSSVTTPKVEAHEISADLNPTPEPPPEPSPSLLTLEEQIAVNKAMLEKAFPDDHTMVRIAKAESRYCTNNVNPVSSARGCFQILKGTFADPIYKCTGDRMKMEDNISCAKKIRAVSGYRPWDSSKHNWSL